MTDALWSMLKNVLLFVLLAVPGFLLVKGKVLKEKDSSVVSTLLLRVGMPFLVLACTLDIQFTAEMTKNLLITGAVGIAFTFAAFFASIFVVGRKDEESVRRMQRFCIVFSNNGFLGIPLAKAVFGDSPVVTYLIIINVITNVSLVTLGAALVSGDNKVVSLKKVLLNPVVIAFALGIVLNLLGVTAYLPEISTYSTHLSNLVTPLSMTVLGMKMAGVNLAKLFTKSSTYFVSVFKLIVLPTLAIAVMVALKMLGAANEEMVLGTFVAFATPTSGLASTFADQYGGDADGAVSYTLGSTIFSIVTIPLLYWLICML